MTDVRQADHDDRLAQDVHPRRDPQAGGGRRGHPAVRALRRAFGRADGDVAVEVGGGEEEFAGRAMGQMGEMAAVVTISPPQLSSIVVATPE